MVTELNPNALQGPLSANVDLDGRVTVFIPANGTNEFTATAKAGEYLAGAGISAVLKANPGRTVQTDANGDTFVAFAVCGRIHDSRTLQLIDSDD